MLSSMYKIKCNIDFFLFLFFSCSLRNNN
ncbi:hypothetical protein PT2222_180083 [Paraburkholderia tropica]